MSSVSLCGQTHLKCSEKIRVLNCLYIAFEIILMRKIELLRLFFCIDIIAHTHKKVFFFTHTQNDTFYHRTGVHICVSKGCCWGYGLWNGTHIITCRHVSSMWICREGECCNDHNGRKPAVVFLSCKTNHHHNSRISS